MSRKTDKREPFLWQRCWDLHEQGLSVREIAFRLDLADRTVEDRLRLARFYARRQEAEEPAWVRAAREMASTYPDAERQRWIWQRWEEWAEKR